MRHLSRQIHKTMNERQHIALTEAQIIAAEKGELQLETRDGRKVLYVNWFRAESRQHENNVLTINTDDGYSFSCYKTGTFFYNDCSKNDIFISEPAIEPTQPEPKFTGFLKDVPVEIIERMMIEQEAQGNKRDASVFDIDFASNKSEGGFDWGDTDLCMKGWNNVSCGKYSDFYKLYPKQEVVAEPAEPAKPAKTEPKPLYEAGEIIEHDTPSGWVDVEYREDRNGQVCVFSNGMYKSIHINNLRKKQTEKTVTLDRKTMTVKEALKHLTNLNQ